MFYITADSSMDIPMSDCLKMAGSVVTKQQEHRCRQRWSLMPTMQ
jgi:hypothetical protein